MPIAVRRIAAVLNAGAGSSDCDEARQSLETIFRAAGVEARITMARSGDDLTRAVEAAIADRVDVIVAGGGDGTIRSVAAQLVDGDIPLGVLPLGTLNHFAKDLHIPLELEPAARVVLAGHVTRVDVGDVNGKIFLNNSSLGLYPRIVRLRQRYKAQGLRKWVVASWATLKVLEQNPVLGVRLDIDGEAVIRRTSLLFIGNNAYKMAGIDAGSRLSVSEGRLAICVVRGGGKWKLLRLVWKVFTGHAEEDPDLDVLLVTEAKIEARAERLPVAFDGEVESMELPLDYRSRPGALSVVVPDPATVAATTPAS